MDRSIVYPGSLPFDSDMLSLQRNVMVAEGFLAQAMLGNGPVVNGLACGPTSPASMSVVIGPGMIASQQYVDPNPYGSLGTDTTDQVVKVGVNTSSWATPIFTAPSAGNSVNILIEAAFSETDTGLLVLPYYDASNPTVAYSGPNNTGAAQNTQRIQRVALTAKVGLPYVTSGGTPNTPAVDSGNVALYVVTISSSTTSITSGNIVVAPGAPFIGGGSLLPGRLIGIQKWIAQGTYTYTPTPGTNATIWEVRGGAASAGGAAVTSATQMAAGSGGGSGAFVRHRATSGFAGAAVVVGQGGAAPAAGANNGADGTASSVTATGFTLNAPGGGHGLGCAAQSASFIVSGGSPGAVGTGGNLLNATGDQGGPAIGIIAGADYYLISGDGGEAEEGGGGASVGTTTAGNAGTTPGAGGSGAASGGSGAGGTAQPGGAGPDGGVWVWEFT